VPYVGPVMLRFENRSCLGGALVLGDDILLGAVPMEDMDLIVSPAHNKVTVNPDSPNFPQALVKCALSTAKKCVRLSTAGTAEVSGP